MTSGASKRIGDLGEMIAVRFLEDRALEIVDRNVYVDGDEIDIVYRRGGECIAVEVKTSSNGDDPLDGFDDVKMGRVQRAASGYRLPIFAIDAIAVTLSPEGAEVRWLRGIG